MTEKEKANFNLNDFAINMADGNIGAYTVIKYLMTVDKCFALNNLATCYDLNIKGSKLYVLFNDCCKNNISVFNQTMTLIKAGVFTIEQIEANLSLTRAIPFVDNKIKMEECAGENRTAQCLEYYKKIAESFEYRFDEVKDKEAKLNKIY